MAEFVGQSVSEGVATITIDRPEVHNAFNEVVIRELTEAFTTAGADEATRLVVLASVGPSFSAGADVNWMRRMIEYSIEENVGDAAAMAAMLDAIRTCPKPVIARVQGATFGGGVGLTAACDIAIALASAIFALTEVKLGILPAVISPYVQEKIGPGALRRYALTAERFDAAEARRIGLVAEVVETEAALDAKIAFFAKLICKNGPEAVAACKNVLREIQPVDWAAATATTTRFIAERRVSKEGQEGLRAFLDKRGAGLGALEDTLMFAKVLIANRGEIAVRIIRTLREMGIASVAVHSDPDRGALHVQVADEAFALPGTTAAETYLRGGPLIEIARECGADAIHPGYGFLSENAGFAGDCAAAGLTFIGPPPEAIAAMGDKIVAKRIMEEAGVPVVPGWVGSADASDATVSEEAERIGYPVLVKAAAGGGGKGMRVVARGSDLAGACAAARREAGAAFGDDRIFLEKYLPRARHVEFQVLADTHGAVTHLSERECSIQRRHQKIVEEAPAPGLAPEVRTRMADAAVRAAAAIGYTNAGTVEFMLTGDDQFYFLEMNTRLQVEHPVTELILGRDLVRDQLHVAAGGVLPVRGDETPIRGHAIECRVYAEDPAHDFLPSTGRIHLFETPDGPGVRVDSGVATGSEVSVHYDPMLAKLIVWAPDRAHAITRMRVALGRFIVLGVTTNIEFLRDLLGHAAFVEGTLHTRFLEEHAIGGPPGPPTLEELAVAAFAVGSRRRVVGVGGDQGAAAADPWVSAGRWRGDAT